MGAGQCFQWATQYPDFMDAIVPFCGSAKTSIHNQVFLEGVKSALLAAHHTSSAGSTFGRVETASTAPENRKWTNEEKTVGLKAFGRGYAGWGFSQAFYRERLHEKGALPHPPPYLPLAPPTVLALDQPNSLLYSIRRKRPRRLHGLLLGGMGAI
jgi:hypothetical protein